MFCARYPTMSLATRSVAFLRSTHLLPFFENEMQNHSFTLLSKGGVVRFDVTALKYGFRLLGTP